MGADLKRYSDTHVAKQWAAVSTTCGCIKAPPH